MQNKHLTTINLEPYTNNGNYPPYNVIAIDDNHYRIEIAIAGFDKEEISVVVENAQLSICGFQETITDVGEEIPNPTYLHQGISARSFERNFALADHVEVTGATVNSGILKVELERNVPESLKPKTIKVK